MQGDIDRISLGMLRCVHEVIQHKNMTTVASHLGISQSAVSQTIARFEKLSGVTITTRKGNNLVIRSEVVATLVEEFFNCANRLGRISRTTENTERPRLGICRYLAQKVILDVPRYTELSRKFNVTIASTESLVKMYEDGAVDVVFRPVLPLEKDIDLALDGTMLWFRSAQTDCPTSCSLPLLVDSSQSIYSSYAQRAVDRTGLSYHVATQVDDWNILTMLLREGIGYLALPEFLAPWLAGHGIVPDRSLPEIDTIRYAVIHDRKIVSYQMALRVFEQLSRLVGQTSVSPPFERARVLNL